MKPATQGSGTRASRGSQGGPQGPKGAQKGPRGPTRVQPLGPEEPTKAQGGPQKPRGAHKGPAHKGLAHRGPAHKAQGRSQVPGPQGPVQRHGGLDPPLPYKGDTWGTMGKLLPPWSPPPLFDFGGLFIGKAVPGSPSGDGSQQAGSNTAIDSFCTVNLQRYGCFCGVMCGI